MNKRENIYSLRGFSKVFKFTVSQTMKNSAYRLSLIIFVALVTLTAPLQYFMARNSMGVAQVAFETNFEKLTATKVTLVNNTDIPFAVSDVADSTIGENAGKIGNLDVVFADTSDADSVVNALKEDEMAIVIGKNAAGYAIDTVESNGSKIPPSELSGVLGRFKSAFEDARLKAANLTSNDIATISSGISGSSTYSEEDYYAEENKTVSEGAYMTYAVAFSIIVMIVISMSTSFITASVTEEKQSKLVESLLVSVRPMALLLGKIIGMMAYVVSIIVLGFIGSKLSNFVLTAAVGKEALASVHGTFDFAIFFSFGIGGFIIMIASLIVGFLSFSLLGGLFGSACVKPEDNQSATGTVMMLVMLGYMGSIFGGIADSNMVNLGLSLIPPFSFFTTPVMFVTGRIQFWTLGLSLGIQVLLLAGLLILSAKTYRNLLLSDSSTPKLAAIFKMAKG